jgi:hypothetical protein
MKFILEYKSYKPKFEVGDVVLIRYWYLKEEECPSELRRRIPHTPVVIKEIKSGRFLVSHDIEGSLIQSAPDEHIRKSDILDHRR